MAVRRIQWQCLLIVLVLGLLPALDAVAQTDDESGAGVVFNFSTPGARSLGMGGAFLGSVDDASAAYSNPAGLLQLSEPEVLVETRRWRHSVPFPAKGRAIGAPTGLGVDTLASVENGVADSELSGLSFAGVVYPRENWAVAAFFHQVARFESSFETEGVFGQVNRLFPIRSSYALDIQQAGLAYAREWANGMALGLSVSSYSFELNSLTQRHDLPDFFFGPATFPAGSEVNFQTQSGDDEAVGFSLGYRWDRSEKVSVGVVYRQAPEFELAVRSESGSPQVSPAQRVLFDDASVVFNIPDFYGFGFSYHPSPEATINLDVHRVFYSQLAEMLHLFFESTDRQRVSSQDYVLEDVTQVHLGGEYVFTQWRLPIAVRAGVWFDPDHRLRAETGPELSRARLPAGENQFHGSVGMGLILGSHFQLDAAVDISEVVDTASVSAIVRF